MNIIAYCFIIFRLPQLIKCEVSSECVFPFYKSNAIYYSCFENSWCSTKKTYTSESDKADCVKTFGSSFIPPKCVFPFKYNDELFFTCTDRGKNRLWCSHSFDNNTKFDYCESMEDACDRFCGLGCNHYMHAQYHHHQQTKLTYSCHKRLKNNDDTDYRSALAKCQNQGPDAKLFSPSSVNTSLQTVAIFKAKRLRVNIFYRNDYWVTNEDKDPWLNFDENMVHNKNKDKCVFMHGSNQTKVGIMEPMDCHTYSDIVSPCTITSIDGIWESWKEWKACFTVDETSIQVRTRKCSNLFGGNKCMGGHSYMLKKCGTRAGIIHEFMWSPWSACNPYSCYLRLFATAFEIRQKYCVSENCTTVAEKRSCKVKCTGVYAAVLVIIAAFIIGGFVMCIIMCKVNDKRDRDSEDESDEEESSEDDEDDEQLSRRDKRRKRRRKKKEAIHRRVEAKRKYRMERFMEEREDETVIPNCTYMRDTVLNKLTE